MEREWTLDTYEGALAEVERLRAAIRESCEDNRSVLLSEPSRTAMCPLAHQLQAQIDHLKAQIGDNSDG